MNPIKIEKKVIPAPVVTKVEPTIDTVQSKTLSAPAVTEQVAVNTDQFNSKDVIYLVAASFQSFEQAEKSLRLFKSLGFDQAEIILKNDQSKFYRISLGTENSMDAGYAKAIELKKTKKVDIWVFKAL